MPVASGIEDSGSSMIHDAMADGMPHRIEGFGEAMVAEADIDSAKRRLSGCRTLQNRGLQMRQIDWLAIDG